MARLEVKNGNVVEALGEFFGKLLESKAADALLVPQETIDGESAAQALVHSPGGLLSPNPVAPIFPSNSGRIVSMLTVGGASGATPVRESAQPGGVIAVVLRPCEVRAVVELVKLQQVVADNLIMIGIDCWGAYPVETYGTKAKEDTDRSVTAEFLKLAQAGEDIPDLRPACGMCLHPSPQCVDIFIDLMGMELGKEFVVRAGSEKGKSALQKMQIEDEEESQEHKEGVAAVLEKRKVRHEQREKIDFMRYFSDTCINCHNCMRVCPVCYCNQCIMDGRMFQYDSSKYIPWARKKEILRMPPDTYLFHLTRMSHIASACVACGQCESACPTGVPLAQLYHYLSIEVQESLGYEAGRSLEEDLPLVTYKEDELQSIES